MKGQVSGASPKFRFLNPDILIYLFYFLEREKEYKVRESEEKVHGWDEIMRNMFHVNHSPAPSVKILPSELPKITPIKFWFNNDNNLTFL